MTKLLLFATYEEAEASLERLDAKLRGDFYQFSEGKIVITGVGLHAAQHATTLHGASACEIWNGGLAASLNPDLPLGSVVEAGVVGKYVPSGPLDAGSEEWVQITLPDLSISDSTFKLISTDFPIHADPHRSELAPHWDLIDMEGYAIAYGARALGKPVKLFKLISDFATPAGRDLIKKNRRRNSELIAKILPFTNI